MAGIADPSSDATADSIAAVNPVDLEEQTQDKEEQQQQQDEEDSGSDRGGGGVEDTEDDEEAALTGPSHRTSLLQNVREFRADLSTLFCLFISSAILPIVFLVGFSGMGYGLQLAYLSNEWMLAVLGQGGFVLLMILIIYVFDVQFWNVALQLLCASSIFFLSCFALCCLVSRVPYGPISVFTILVPVSIFAIKRIFFQKAPAHIFVGTYHTIYVLLGTLILSSFTFWCKGNFWDTAKNAEYSHAAGCKADFTDEPSCESQNVTGMPCFFDENYEDIRFSKDCPSHCIDVYEACNEAFIIWAFPGLAAMALFVMGFISKFMENPGDPHQLYRVGTLAKAFAIFLFLFWIFASLVGAGEGLVNSLIAFAMSICIGSGIVFSIVFWNSLADSSRDIFDALSRKAESFANPLRGLVMLGLSPVLVVYVLLSIVNQFIRRFFIRHICREHMTDEEYEHKGVFTLAVDSQIKYYKTWDHAKVLSYAVYWGIAYLFLSVLGSRFVTVFLSWLIETTQNLHISLVTGIIVAVGMVLFLLPPIPGIPIYLAGGIVLVNVGRDYFGVYASIVYACFVSLIIKLLGCCMQQKLIGGTLGSNIKVRQAVGINSEGIRAMRVILSENGFTRRKVAVLVGGPDWPVSVLCGILGLNLFPILVGTLPVALLIVPSVLSGSCAYLGSLEEDGVEKYPFADTLGAISAAFIAGTMLYFTLSAVNAVKDTLENDKETIEAIPFDEAVQEADAEAVKVSEAYHRVTIWKEVPIFMKIVLILAVLCMTTCCYMLMIFGKRCFKDYDLMYTIDEHLDGNWINLVLPLGRVALLLFVISYALLLVFETWAKIKAKALMETLDESGTTSLLSE